MSTIAIADFLVESKRIAAMVDLINAAFGTGSQTNTASKGGTNAEAAILALGDAEQLNALLPGATRLKAALTQENYYGGLYAWLRELDTHVGGINTYLGTHASYVHYHLRTVDPKILPRYVFPPVTELANATHSGTWSDTSEVNTIDTSVYGAGLVEFLTQAAIGAADIDVTINGEDFDGNTVQASGTIPASTGDATVVAIAGSVRFRTITSLAISGGTSGDAFKIQTTFDRTPSGCA